MVLGTTFSQPLSEGPKLKTKDNQHQQHTLHHPSLGLTFSLERPAARRRGVCPPRAGPNPLMPDVFIVTPGPEGNGQELARLCRRVWGCEVWGCGMSGRGVWGLQTISFVSPGIDYGPF